MALSSAALMLFLLTVNFPDPPGKYFRITVVDDQTGRGVPLVELSTVNHIRLYTDSNGTVAFYEPGLMNQEVFFHVRSHGYEYLADGFGFRGKSLHVTGGGSANLAIKRLNIAQRLYRITGEGIYADSMLAGEPVPIRQPLLNGRVFGSDSVVRSVYKNKIYWFWGDTNRPAYPLGNFHVPGATTELPGHGGLDPERGIDLAYFVDPKGIAKATAPLPGPGAVWIFGLAVVHDELKRERMLAGYVRVRDGSMQPLERGLVEFDDDQKEWRKVAQFDKDSRLHPEGHTLQRTVRGVPYVYYCTPYPLLRVPADAEKMKKQESYESYTCLKTGTRLEQWQIDRGASGKVRYAWKKNTPPVAPAEQMKLIENGLLKPAEALLRLQDVETGKPVSAHAGSVSWNDYRQRWVMIAVESFGASMLGEVWYAEAETPLGPWIYARKIVTHEKYSFYNPVHHPLFDKEKGRVIFFEGTYSQTFSGNAEATPRYDYNQILYKLDLADPRLTLPVSHDPIPEDN